MLELSFYMNYPFKGGGHAQARDHNFLERISKTIFFSPNSSV